MTPSPKILLLALFLQGLVSTISAQQAEDRALILSKTNVSALSQFSVEAHQSYLQALSEATTLSIPMTVVVNQGRAGYFSGFNANGEATYDFDDNRNAAITARVDRIREGGSSGLNLDGTDIVIGQWEASGTAWPFHQDLVDKITSPEDAETSAHATHTAGTMIGTGINPNGRGMAPAALLISRRSNNNEAEMADFAAAGGILSNHSYSTGDPDGEIPLYGRYTSNASEWDDIVYNAPYFLICKSAGNNRNDGVNIPDGGYDIIFTVSASKNVITVGAIDDLIDYQGPTSVTQSEFSNWGPTDDWRIKPDITTNGISMISADDDNLTDYRSRSGTSMSVAVVTGAVALLQQHYHNLNGVYMQAATVKALLINTADEAGEHDGPDFQSGWGLLNAERAAELISNDQIVASIQELSLQNGTSFTAEIEVDGQTSLALSLVWSDPGGAPSFGEDNQSPRLINDLDVRISGNDTVYEPWVMTPNAASDNFEDAASRGDNFRDNIERIDINNIAAGTYTVSITHKGSLVNNEQDFSLVINGISSTVSSVSEQSDLTHKLLVYPNPTAQGNLHIVLPAEVPNCQHSIKVLDFQGRLLQQLSSSSRDIELPTIGLDPGAYLLVIKNEFFTERRVVIVE